VSVRQSRKEIVAWVGSQVLPHEGAVRAWLKRWMGRAQDIEDVIQEAYCRLASMSDVSHIVSGRAYLFQTTRNIVLEQVRRSKIVNIQNVADLASLSAIDESPPPEQVVSGVRELQRVQQMIDQLPRPCRRVFVLRRVYGESQRDIARRFGISESAVEKQAMRGLKLILKALESGDERAGTAGVSTAGGRAEAGGARAVGSTGSGVADGADDGLTEKRARDR